MANIQQASLDGTDHQNARKQDLSLLEQISRASSRARDGDNSKLRQQLNSRAAELDGKIQESCDAVSTTLLRRAEETESKVAAMAATTTQRADEIERTSKQAVDKLTSGLGNAEKKAASDQESGGATGALKDAGKGITEGLKGLFGQ